MTTTPRPTPNKTPSRARTHGNLKTWLGSRGFVTHIALPLPPPLASEEEEVEAAACVTLIDPSSTSPAIRGRRRAAILTLWTDIGADALLSGGGRPAGEGRHDRLGGEKEL